MVSQNTKCGILRNSREMHKFINPSGAFVSLSGNKSSPASNLDWPFQFHEQSWPFYDRLAGWVCFGDRSTESSCPFASISIYNSQDHKSISPISSINFHRQLPLAFLSPRFLKSQNNYRATKMHILAIDDDDRKMYLGRTCVHRRCLSVKQ